VTADLAEWVLSAALLGKALLELLLELLELLLEGHFFATRPAGS